MQMLPFTLVFATDGEGQHCAEATKSPRPGETLHDWSASDEAVDDHDHCDHEQQMDQPPTDVHHEKAENPKDEENYRDRPKHDGILSRSELHPARQTNSPALRVAACGLALVAGHSVDHGNQHAAHLK